MIMAKTNYLSRGQNRESVIKVSLKVIMLNFVLFTMALGQNNVPVVSNVSTQMDTLTNILTVAYDLYDAEADTMAVSFLLSDDDGLTYFSEDSVLESVWGDVGYPIMSGIERTISCNFSPDPGKTYRAKIVADDGFEIDLTEIVAQVDTVRLLNDLNQIVGIRHRTAGFTNLRNTITFIEDQYMENGLQVSRHEFMYGAYQAVNLIGRLPGQAAADSVFIIDGHFDTVHNSGGADDNGTGTVGMLEAMRILSAYNFKKSIDFIGFDLEETGLIGSERYVAEAIPNDEHIVGVFNLEMLGYYSDEPGTQTIPAGFELLFPDEVDSIIAHDYRGNFVLNIANEYSNEIMTQFNNCAALYVPDLKVISLAVPGNGEIAPDLRRSDHAPFWDAGFQAIEITDGGDTRNPYYHTMNDTIGSLNFQFMANILKASVATVAEMAGIMHCGIGVSDTIDFIPEALSVSDSPGELLPEFTLNQNYPNPFNPTTTISYYLSEQSSVELTIFDIRGQEIRTLYDSEQPPGNYKLQWNGMDQAGNPVSTGVYFCRLNMGSHVRHSEPVEEGGTGSFSQTIKMIYLR